MRWFVALVALAGAVLPGYFGYQVYQVLSHPGAEVGIGIIRQANTPEAKEALAGFDRFTLFTYSLFAAAAAGVLGALLAIKRWRLLTALLLLLVPAASAYLFPIAKGRPIVGILLAPLFLAGGWALLIQRRPKIAVDAGEGDEAGEEPTEVTRFSCLSCGTNLKSSAPLPVGKSFPCPQCHESVTVEPRQRRARLAGKGEPAPDWKPRRKAVTFLLALLILGLVGGGVAYVIFQNPDVFKESDKNKKKTANRPGGTLRDGVPSLPVPERVVATDVEDAPPVAQLGRRRRLPQRRWVARPRAEALDVTGRYEQ